MNEIIKISSSKIEGAIVQTISARELHNFLEVKSRFNDWITNRIKEYKFNEDQDFITLTKNLVSGGSQKEYHLSLDMAKELSMVERNEKGKQARQYFIECERKAKEPKTIHDVLNDPGEMRGLLLVYTEKVLALQEENKTLTIDSKALERIAKAEGSLCITDAAKTLQIRPKNLFQWLAENKWIYKRIGCAHYCAYQSKQIQGLLEHKVTTVLRADGSEKITEQVRVTPRGLEKLSKLISTNVVDVTKEIEYG